VSSRARDQLAQIDQVSAEVSQRVVDFNTKVANIVATRENPVTKLAKQMKKTKVVKRKRICS
jgi:hypothetical protein